MEATPKEKIQATLDRVASKKEEWHALSPQKKLTYLYKVSHQSTMAVISSVVVPVVQIRDLNEEHFEEWSNLGYKGLGCNVCIIWIKGDVLLCCCVVVVLRNTAVCGCVVHTPVQIEPSQLRHSIEEINRFFQDAEKPSTLLCLRVWQSFNFVLFLL